MRDLEAGRALPSTLQLARLAELYQCAVQELVTGRAEPEAAPLALDAAIRAYRDGGISRGRLLEIGRDYGLTADETLDRAGI